MNNSTGNSADNKGLETDDERHARWESEYQQSLIKRSVLGILGGAILSASISYGAHAATSEPICLERRVSPRSMEVRCPPLHNFSEDELQRYGSGILISTILGGLMLGLTTKKKGYRGI